MSLTTGSRIGPYEISDQIGVGGMGEVYRAVDANLGRAVAIKVLPDTMAHDAERMARFEREAKTLASLNHPNIAQVFGLEKSGPAGAQIQALVMELVEGPTLADRIAAGPIPLDEAVPIAIQIAEALESAHDLGIVHRDLKPANVKVRADGTVKVLDFGLAKAMDWAGGAGGTGVAGGANLANSPTIASPAMTQAGIILGTAAYMSPEQAKGRIVDRRADVWAFGCVLFEMLSGTRAFAGEDISDVLVSVMRDEPAWPRLPPSTPAHITSLLKRCLQKDPKKRLPHIGVARLDLVEEGPSAVERTAFASNPRGRVIERTAFALVGAAVVAAIWLGVRPTTPVVAPAKAFRFEIAAPAGGVLSGAGGVPRFSVSPDGTAVVYQAETAGELPRFWLRRLDSTESRPLERSATGGTSGGRSAQQPFWSPDGRRIAYFDEDLRKLKVLDLPTGETQSLCDVPGNQLGGSWNADVILLSSAGTNGVQKISANGGAVTQVTRVAGDESHLWPDFLADGKHFVYFSASENNSGIHVASIDGGEPKRLVGSTGMGRFAPPNQLLYVRGDALVTQTLDLDRLELTGEPVVVSDAIMRTPAGRVAVSASRDGTLVFATGGFAPDVSEMVWVDRTGRVDTAVPPIPFSGSGLRLSPDGKTLSYPRATGTSVEIWMYDIVRQIPTRLSSDGGALDSSPAFSADGLQVLFRRRLADGVTAIYQQPVSGASPGGVILKTDQSDFASPHEVSSDGRFLLYSATRGLRRGLWLYPLAATAAPKPYLETGGTLSGPGALSPDGHFLAHVTSQQVFVQTFPDPSLGRWALSGPGAGYPRWPRHAQEVFFVDAEGWISSARVSLAPQVQIGEPSRLFQLPGGAQLAQGYRYDVMPDGQRFVVARRRGTIAPVSLTVSTNWLAGLKK